MLPKVSEPSVRKYTPKVELAGNIYRVPENINFSEEEEKTLNFWNKNKVFERCLLQSKGKPR